MNKRGFTLMEVLAVLLLLAVIASLAVPGIRAANFAIKNARAKNAAKELIEGINNYRLATRGGTVNAFNNFSGSFDTSCTTNVNTGIPGNVSAISVGQLAPCGFLSPKDFKNIPYTFYYGSLPTFASSIPSKEGDVVLVALGNNQQKAGARYYTAPANVNNANYAIYIDQRLIPLEYEK